MSGDTREAERLRRLRTWRVVREDDVWTLVPEYPTTPMTMHEATHFRDGIYKMFPSTLDGRPVIVPEFAEELDLEHGQTVDIGEIITAWGEFVVGRINPVIETAAKTLLPAVASQLDALHSALVGADDAE